MPQLYTIGHSTHTLEEFFAILDAHHVSHMVDVRSIPAHEESLGLMRVSLQNQLTAFAVIDSGKRPLQLYYPEPKK